MIDNLKLSILFDNYPHNPRMETSWGFSCFIEGAEKNLLFDTGADGKILHHNMETAGIDPGQIDIILLSHNHWDHTGGLEALLPDIRDVGIYIPESFAGKFKNSIEKHGNRLYGVNDFAEILPAVYTTGEMGFMIIEQSLISRTDKGLVVMTGCAHPGIIDIVARADEAFEDPINLVMGGFHYRDKSKAECRQLAKFLKERSVQKVMPTHCSGDQTREILKEAFGENYVEGGVGRVVLVN